MGMNCEVRRIEEVTVLDLAGRITLGDAFGLGHGSATRLHDLIRDEVAKGHTTILLNLREITYMDSHGIGDLVACLTTIRSHGGQLRICNASGLVDNLLRRTHLNTVLNLDQDEATSLQAFAKPLTKGASAA